ncbi:4-hydroxy-tetrahydrodipicolinate synthase [Xenophilus sp. AP218F]|nr:4-hydroxy-tetrahydrodipicolinate synthase [Xenophilus sp. AP218F]
MARHWGKVLTAMVTPFDEQGGLNLDMARQLARHLAANGSDGLIVAATTGEAPTLGDAERMDLIRTVSEAVTVPVLAGVGCADARHAVALAARAADAGAAGAFVVSPYYNRPPQAGIEAYFRAVAAATRLPVMVYDVPGRTGRRIARDVLLRLFSEVDNIVAFKDATGDPAAAASLVASAGRHFDLYSGDDALTLPLLAVGAVGVVGTSTHWTGREFAAMIAAFEQGEVQRARAINAALQESFAFANSEAVVFSMAVKAMLRSQGLAVGQCRLPLPATGADEESRAQAVWQRLQAWRQEAM